MILNGRYKKGKIPEKWDGNAGERIALKIKSFYQKIIFFFILIFNSSILSQEIPDSYFSLRKAFHQHSIGQNWDINTNLGALRYQDLEIFNSNDSLVKSDIFFGLKSLNDNILVYGDSRLIFNKYYYLFYKINVTNNPDAFRYFLESPDKKKV